MGQNFTPIPMGALAVPSTFNNPLGELDAAIGKHNLDATVDPTANDDADDGYGVGSRWVNVATDSAFMCVDATPGAAIWTQLNAAEGGGAVEVIALTVLTEEATTVAFSSIPGDYEVLQLHWLIRDECANDELYVQFNDDTGYSYQHYTRERYDYADIYESISATSLVIASLTGSNINPPASYANPGTLWIPGYAGTTFYKSLHAHVGVFYSSINPNYPSGGVGRWLSTSAITKILLGSTYGYHFEVGSRFVLLGIKGS
jgi:hypothetical protein